MPELNINGNVSPSPMVFCPTPYLLWISLSGISASWFIFTFDYSTFVLSLLSLCREFLKKCRDNDRYVFGLKKYAEKYDLLDSFKQLDQTCINWGRKKKKTGSPTEEASVVDTPLVSD